MMNKKGNNKDKSKPTKKTEKLDDINKLTNGSHPISEKDGNRYLQNHPDDDE